MNQNHLPAFKFIIVVFFLVMTLSCEPESTGGGHGFTSSGPLDSSLALDSTSASDAATAMGICDGLVSAEWVLPDGTAKPADASYDLGHGILSGFGNSVVVREGAKLLALSSGTARQPGDTGYVATSYDKGYVNNCPSGYPVAEPTAPTPGDGHDGIGLRVVLEIPDGVSGFSVDYKYYTRDFPDDLQSAYVDQCSGLMAPDPGTWTFPDGNILFDTTGNPLFSSTGAIQVGVGMPEGTADLSGTGFENYGATSWLTTTLTTANFTFSPGDQITIIFAIWDSGDGNFDSTLLLDNFQWIPTT